MVTPAQPTPRFLGQSDKLGRYEVIRQIAVGGMAELYLARTVGMEGFEKLVCVKRILPQYANNPSFVNMFLNEARLAATLHHPNIAQVYDIGQEQGEYFFAMEYVHGEDLGRLVTTAQESGVPISFDCALTLVSGLCAGLHYAHEKASPDGKPLGVVHRDVSPTNVLVSYDGAVKLVDFGIARAGGEPAQSAVGGLKGKISYMSPEQCRGKAGLDRRSDVFSVGSILYELTTGRRPFVDETEYAVLAQIVNRDADPPSTVMPGYPPALEAIVMRALARDVNRRFSTALELQNQLEDYAHDNRLRVSPLVLARLMSTLFPARLEEWDHARAQGAFFVEQHVVRTLIESGKTPEASRYVPTPLPPPYEEFGVQHEGAPVPVGRGSAQRIGEGVGTQSAPSTAAQLRPTTPHPVAMPAEPVERPSTPGPVAAPVSQPRLPTPTPGPVATPVSQPRPPTPLPGSVIQPRPPTPPPVPGQAPLPGVRYAMPVPNMPGAVPIVAPMTAPPMTIPPIASAGTLVSSALQAGSSAASSTMPPLPPMATPPPGAPYISAASDFGPGGPVDAGRGSGGYAGYGPPAVAADPGYAAYAAPAPPRAHRVSEARPALMIRTDKRARRALVIATGAVALAAVALVLVLSGRASTAPSAQPAGFAPVATPAQADEPAGPSAPAKRAGGPVAEPPAAAPAVAPVAAPSRSRAAAAGNRPSAPAGAAQAAAAPEPAKPSAPAGALSTAPDASDAAAGPNKKRPDPPKPARPKKPPEVKRADPKRAKVDSKEPSWNDDSPFMPVSQPKH